MADFQTLVLPAAKLSLGYAEMVTDGVSENDFGRMVETSNSPAFVIGHLSIYPDKAMEMIGRGSDAQPDESYLKLFEAGVDCVDDPEGQVYPSKDALMARFMARHQALIEILAETPDEVFDRENPMERMRERFPTIGAMINFLLTGHIMMHLGQVSTWRRCMGLGPAIK